MTHPQFAVAFSEATHIGRVRTHNEDALLSQPKVGVWVVADGMGGHQEGALASSHIVEILRMTPRPHCIDDLTADVEQRLQAGHTWLLREAQRRGADAIIGSTVVALLAWDSSFVCLWAGDSRLYRLQHDKFVQLTRDHTPIQELVDAGKMLERNAENHPLANVITRAVGSGTPLELDKVTGHLSPNDLFLLCSDGLSKMVPKEQIEVILKEEPLDRVAQTLVTEALARGGRDNVTVIVVSFREKKPMET
jgi:serine/threonine-protein phosphatase Stp1